MLTGIVRFIDDMEDKHPQPGEDEEPRSGSSEEIKA